MVQDGCMVSIKVKKKVIGALLNGHHTPLTPKPAKILHFALPFIPL